jgi:hypothetical protein
MPLQLALPKDLTKDFRKLLAFGSGIGIEIGANALEVIAARVRPGKIEVLGRLVIEDYATRPAAEWGAEYGRFLASLGMSHLAATVLLPRREVIVRQMALPGVAPKDVEGAIRFQIDTMHPYGEEEVVWGWSRLAYGSVLVGIAKRDAIERYRTTFLEAGIAVTSFTFSAAAVHAAIRLNGAAHGAGFLALGRTATGAVEAYGESQAKPVFSAEFQLPPQRATVLALAELRLPPETQALTLEQVLPKPAINPVENDLSRNALPYATALAGACPRLAPSANVLPLEHRRSNSRAMLIPSLVLAGVLLLLAGGIFGYRAWVDRKYLAELNAEIAKVEPLAQRARSLERQVLRARTQTEILDRFRAQTRLDLDALNELTKIIEPPAWANVTNLNRDVARIMGEAPAAAALVKILDSSPFFHNTAADSISRAQGGTGETFQIHTSREAGK